MPVGAQPPSKSSGGQAWTAYGSLPQFEGISRNREYGGMAEMERHP